MDGSPDTHPEALPGAIVPSHPVCRLGVDALPSELAFWALWHCRHARPPDTSPLR